MRTCRRVLSWLLLLGTGCAFFKPPPPPPPPPFGAYHAAHFDLHAVSRILLLPLANESPFPYVADEMGTALAAELQRLGCFEVVVAPRCPEFCAFQGVHTSGRFDEQAFLDLARTFKVDGILVGSVTQYHPYVPPRIGLSLQLICPGEGVVIASVDGLWDARQKELAEEARVYYRDTVCLFHAPSASELAITSPQLYQRFVAHEVVEALVDRPPPPPPPAPKHDADPGKSKPITEDKGKPTAAEPDLPKPAGVSQ